MRAKALGTIHSAKLRTNRRPSTDFAASLDLTKINFGRIGSIQRAQVIKELGGEVAAKSFFSQFEFEHSQPLIDDLEARLRGNIVPTDTDQTGWLLLREQARRWATRNDLPEPDGKIRHEHLVQIITKRRPAPIPQDFTVPPSYQVPSGAFHNEFMARIATELRQVSVLWGSPGRGKSTYLSFLVKALRDAGLPTVRHHYFLSLHDGTTDRVSFTEISNSILSQIEALYPDAVRGRENRPEALRSWLEACGRHFATKGKRFYVVIDGLDHVWREQQNTTQMEHLFNHLLPCPDNVFLLVGTQKVLPNQLPLKLVRTAQDSDWIEIPAMDEIAVDAWIKAQYDAGRLLLREQLHPDRRTELASIGHAFFEICGGNPLHLIYSFEALVRRGAVVTADEIYLLPSCPDGDIREYYRSLWSRLPASARKVLHLIAGSDFRWPPAGLRKCAGSFEEVDHLLEHRRTGLAPFHGSILAYAREQNDHQSTFSSLLPNVIRWLEREAPEYWRWAWLWIMRARNGDTENLVTLTTRDWVVQSLANGWPAEQIVTILEEAETQSFAANDYVRTGQLRSLKNRLENGPNQQINRFNDYTESAVRAANNRQQILNMADDLASADDIEIITLLRCLNGADVEGIGTDCCEQLLKDVNLWITSTRGTNEEFVVLVENLIEALVEFGRLNPKTFIKFIRQFSARDRLYRSFLKHALRTRNFDLACEMHSEMDDSDHDRWRNAVEKVIVQIACAEEIDLTHRLTPTREITPLLSCWYRIKGLQPPQPCNLTDLSPTGVTGEYHYGSNPLVEDFFHGVFFFGLDTALQIEGKCSPVFPGIDRAKVGWLQQAADHLWDAAFNIGQKRCALGFEALFLELASLAPVDYERPSEPSSAQYRAFRAVVGDIGLGLHALKCAISEASRIDPNAFALARGSSHWEDELWIAREIEARGMWFDPAGVEVLINELEETQSKHVNQFSERAERWIDLAQLSVLYGIKNSKKYLVRAADCIIGYGWRKDVRIFDVLSAIECIHEAGVIDVGPWLKLLAPIIDQITVFTDGDETNHAPEAFVSLVAQAKPEWLPRLYSYYIAEEEHLLAEHTLAAVFRIVKFSDAASKALVNSVLERKDLSELEELRNNGRPQLGGLLKKRRAFLGINASRRESTPKVSRQEAKKRMEETGWGGVSPRVNKFGPDQLKEFLQHLSRPELGFMRREEASVRWLKYWAEKGSGLVALATLDNYYRSLDNPHEINHMLDDAFEVSLALEGKKKAYKWLVRAHIERYGWNSFWDRSDRVAKRLAFAAKHYKEKWREFILDTSRPAPYWEKRGRGFSFGTNQLVDYLVMVKQTALATQLTNAMVQRTLAEVGDQPIPPSRWLS